MKCAWAKPEASKFHHSAPPDPAGKSPTLPEAAAPHPLVGIEHGLVATAMP